MGVLTFIGQYLGEFLVDGYDRPVGFGDCIYYTFLHVVNLNTPILNLLSDCIHSAYADVYSYMFIVVHTSFCR